MPLQFNTPEIFELSKWGVFNIFSFHRTIAAALSSPVLAGNLASTPFPRLNAPIGWTLLLQRLNWGNTSQGNVRFKLFDERGFNIESTVYASNLDNPDILFFASSFIEWQLWNISNPAIDVYVECSCWYYQYQRRNEERVKKAFNLALAGRI